MPTLTQHALDTLADRLASRRQAGLLRLLRTADNLIDFCSNDYLGMARSPELRAAIQQADYELPALRTGATGSRLLAGQTALANEVEQALATQYQTEAALIFNSGYDANVGMLACLPQAGDTLLTDELIHASMIDGARLSYAKRHRFRHNDLADLEQQLRSVTGAAASGQVFVAVESVYSMDGDMAPLQALVDLCDRYGAALLVDEAHATGVFGPRGEGLVVALGLQDRVLARIHTFGKALGVHGAAVVGSAVLRDYLINFARPFIYSTALPPHSLLAIRCAHLLLSTQPGPRQQLHDRLTYFQEQVSGKLPGRTWTNSQSPIQCLIVPGNHNARRVATVAQNAGFDVRAILSPTVPVGQERLRICIHAFNTEPEIDRLVESLFMAEDPEQA
ncbi:aminotransferase class I/II-fold pyridoxal phosphate-dependent enzyme [Spirosoma utsteinense]|uniref:8-amino-7-oxononanoate synthase n=1 Tax=Spirosoma utsteinense TaxID=2585773 RepID=A0ABR6W1W3_9BACT|nr:8-amino-7-oxononanoate synthase [Spirosoma utsteinense]MBC3783750.1 8-amino-7-oxononanoate synthase [Spirosoma utsteinense]MBC3790106.1 8-amino-7-oxononanoate synthase [Spirosoma utsteinense]